MQLSSGFNSVELINNFVGGYACEIDFGAHYSVYSNKTMGDVCLPSIGQP